MASLVFLITGATTGLGLALIEHLLSRNQNDRIIATGRSATTKLAYLASKPNVKILDFDVTITKKEMDKFVDTAVKLWGRIDVLISNAVVREMRSAEEVDEHFINHLFTTNFLAPMRLTSALLPYFRARHTGVLAYVSCSSACWGPLPFTSAYSASKAALSSYVESLHRELMAIPFPSPKAGIKAVVFEVGGMPTASGGVKVPSGSFVIREIDKAIADEIPDSQSSGSQERSLLEGKGFPNIPEYTQGFMNTVVTLSPHDNPRKYTPSDPKEVARAMVDIVKGEGVAKGKKWVVRVPLGADAFEGVQRRCMETMGLLGMWKECEDLGAKPEAVTAWGAEAAGSRQKWVPGNEMRKMTSVWETERPF